ncbi:hypothetical protein GJ496_008534 [Pomphorhynchus laevis]|nr:hypothetical protein GJ496_008534 [Pomphorhynchus laevis]
MTDFINSSQLLHWSFPDLDAVTNTRKALNDCHVISFEELEQFRAILENELIRFMKYTDEQLKISRQTMHIALCFHKRFYLRSSLMDYHPLLILLSCVYLAVKVDEVNPGISNFAKFAKVFLQCYMDKQYSAQLISRCITYYELVIVEKLDYQIMIHCPLRALRGFFIDMRCRWIDVDHVFLEKIRPFAEEITTKAILADCLLTFTPSAIALTSIIYAACKDQPGFNFDEYIMNLLLSSSANSVEQGRKLRSMLRKISNAMKRFDEFYSKINLMDNGIKERLQKIKQYIPASRFELDQITEAVGVLQTLDLDESFSK